MVAYHDTEWGVPLHDEQRLFEFLVLEGMQAGLSWSTILNKRENFRAAFHHFDVARVARYTQADVDRLLGDAGIIRNRLKIAATINNAQRFIEVQNEFGSFEVVRKWLNRASAIIVWLSAIYLVYNLTRGA
jgi:DNA-3-methyladenine glycosylase I